MRPQKVSVDTWSMLIASVSCIGLAIAGRILIRLIQAVFWLPGHLQKMQKQIEETMREQNAFERSLNMENLKNEVLFKDFAKAKAIEANSVNNNQEILAESNELQEEIAEQGDVVEVAEDDIDIDVEATEKNKDV